MKIQFDFIRSDDFSVNSGNTEVEMATPEVKEPKKGFFQRIREALQEWSNAEYTQTAIDDTQV